MTLVMTLEFDPGSHCDGVPFTATGSAFSALCNCMTFMLHDIAWCCYKGSRDESSLGTLWKGQSEWHMHRRHEYL